MAETLVFRPRRSYGWAWLGGIGLAVIGLAVPSLLALAGEESAGGAVLFVVVLNLAIGLPFLVLAAWFPTMRYELADDALVLRYGPVLNYRIPLDEIERIRRRDLRISLWSSLRLPGVALFGVPYADLGTVKMCATSAAQGILLVETARQKYGLTPADEMALVAALQERMGR